MGSDKGTFSQMYFVYLKTEAEEKQIPLDRKAVSTAIEEVYTGKLSIDR